MSEVEKHEPSVTKTVSNVGGLCLAKAKTESSTLGFGLANGLAAGP